MRLSNVSPTNQVFFTGHFVAGIVQLGKTTSNTCTVFAGRLRGVFAVFVCLAKLDTHTSLCDTLWLVAVRTIFVFFALHRWLRLTLFLFANLVDFAVLVFTTTTLVFFRTIDRLDAL